MKTANFLILSVAIFFVSGCAQTIVSCAAFKPIRPMTADVLTMSDSMVAQVLNHNASGIRNCGWKP